MSLERSQNALELLSFIAENGPKTLYEIHKEKGMRRSSVHLALEILNEKNLICLDIEESRKRDRNAKVYALTIKGLIVFLSNYNLPKSPAGWRARALPSESLEEAIKKLEEKLKREFGIYRLEVDRFKEILKKNGELLQYPLFLHCHSFEQTIPDIYENFIKIAQRILEEPPSKWHILSVNRFRTKKKKIEKSLKMAQKFFTGKFVVFQGEKETPFDPIAFEKQRLELVKEELRTVFRIEDEFLRESFFMYFLMWFRGSRVKLPNRDLYHYTKSLHDKEKKRFNSNKQVLDKWLAVFNSSARA